MKKLCVTIALALFVGVLIAWAQSGSSISFSTSGNCTAPAPNITSICGTATNVMLSLNGAPYVGLQGTPGPAGPAGPIGAAGPAGAVGPAGAKGANGTNGTNGTNGLPGVAGPVGPIGLTGPAGPQGPKGDPGTGGNFTSFNCTSFSIVNGIASGTGCTTQ
jgi:hypothetical protein